MINRYMRVLNQKLILKHIKLASPLGIKDAILCQIWFKLNKYWFDQYMSNEIVYQINTEYNIFLYNLNESINFNLF